MCHTTVMSACTVQQAKCCIISVQILSIYGCTALVDLGRFFQFLIHSQQESLDGGSARHKATILTQNNTSTE
jgi:hypothetical protein